MESLADQVLPWIRTTQRDLYRWSAANAHGADMHQGVDVLEQAHESGLYPAAEVYQVTHKALSSAIRVIARADDSSGIIGDACRRLLELHPRAAAAARIAPRKLIDWMLKFQFGETEVDYFHIDPVAYADALGEAGMASYRRRLEEIAAQHSYSMATIHQYSGFGHDLFTLRYNAERLAVYDRDPEAIIRTHARDQKVPAWLQDTAEALEEIGEHDLAIEWAQKAAEHPGATHQAQAAARYWCQLLETHRGQDQLLEAKRWIFQTWPSSATAVNYHDTAGEEALQEIVTRLKQQPSPRDLVVFYHRGLKDVHHAWMAAQTYGLQDADVWQALAQDYQDHDPAAVIPVLQDLAVTELENTGAKHYKRAAKTLSQAHRLAHHTGREEEFQAFIHQLREQHKRRPRLGTEFDRAGLP